MKPKKQPQNYLEKIPSIPSHLRFTADENGIVTLEIENRGMMNRIAQKLFKKPPVSYIHLDDLGSFVWQKIDGKKTILEFAPLVEERFGEKANPLYERLAQYFKILESYGFVSFLPKES